MLKRIRALLGRRGRSATPPGPPPAGPTHAARAPSPQRPTVVHHGPKVVHWPIAEADLDAEAVKIVKRLTRFDHRAYLVGGCVRDLLLDRRPKDFDVGTSATPRQIKRVFRNCRIIGRRFRLAHIYFQNGKIIEVATFRARDEQEEPGADGDGLDEQDLLIRDDNIFGTPEEDALRRDFTINALFYDVEEGTVLDHADGLSDLRRKVVRTIGDPEIRFREDPIRILRAIKFAARLSFTIEGGTLDALRATRRELVKAATPRVLEEINRFCRGGAARRSFELLDETGTFDVVFPELGRPYAADRGAWELMLDLLERMNATRSGNGREIRTGEIFAAVLLPLVAQRLVGNGRHGGSRTRGPHAPHIADELLQPLARRLRIPRREQEHCRQILGTLQRLLASDGLRRGARRALLERECLPDSLWMLDLLAERRGDVFAAARARLDGLRREPAEGGGDEARPAEGPPGRAPRSRRRRRRRGAGGGAARGDAETAPAVESAPKPGMPSPWDDNYFFAALPSAPDSVEDGGAVAAPPAAAEPAVAESSGRRRRRRSRRRRRGPSRGGGEPQSGGSEEGGDPDGRLADGPRR